MTRGLFITGTDTSVGKTRIGAALARLVTARGLSVKVRKPVESGCALRNDRPFPADAEMLREAAGANDALDIVCPYAFRAPVSPERAAQLEGRSVTLADLERACLAGVNDPDFLLVEGAGGFLSPLTPDGFVADLAQRLALPVVLVVADQLGCLNHALLTVEAIRARGLTLAGVMLNQLEPRFESAMDNAADLAKRLRFPVINVPHAPAGGGTVVDAALASFAASL